MLVLCTLKGLDAQSHNLPEALAVEKKSHCSDLLFIMKATTVFSPYLQKNKMFTFVKYTELTYLEVTQTDFTLLVCLGMRLKKKVDTHFCSSA